MKRTKQSKTKNRLYLLTWLLIPLLLMWISVTYLIGLNRGVAWVREEQSQTTSVTPIIQKTPFTWNGEGLITLWFDDGWSTQFTVAYPLLQEYGLKAVIAPSTQLVGYDAYVTWPQLKQLQYKGWEIASHAKHHACDELTKDSAEYIREEMKGSQDDLRAHNLYASTYVAPCGVVTKQMVDVSREYYILMRGSEPGVTALPVTNYSGINVRTILETTTPEEVKIWIEEAQSTKSWLNIVFHQIDDSTSEFSVTPKNLKAMLEVITVSDSTVVTPDDVLQISGGAK